MAVDQSTIAGCKRALNLTCIKDGDGYWYFEFGPVYLIFGDGSPNGIITAPGGSIYIDIGATNDIYLNTSGATAGTTWTAQD